MDNLLIKKLENIKPLVSNTPMIKVRVNVDGKIKNIYCKCEWYSLTGSIKDKVAYQIYHDMIAENLLHSGDNIVEVSSGNMGISLCALGNNLGLHTTILLPKNMSEERKKILKLYGANLIETNDFKQAFSLCKQFEKKGYICTHQFENKSNYTAHYQITGSEILAKIKNTSVKNFVCGVGTSGSLSGIGDKLKQIGIKTFALEPLNARILSNKKPFSKHLLQGLADEIVPKLYNKKLSSKIIQISDFDAIKMSQMLCSKLSLGVGISSGANFLASCLLSGDTVTVLPDDNKKYLTTKLCDKVESSVCDYIQLLDFSFV